MQISRQTCLLTFNAQRLHMEDAIPVLPTLSVLPFLSIPDRFLESAGPKDLEITREGLPGEIGDAGSS